MNYIYLIAIILVQAAGCYAQNKSSASTGTTKDSVINNTIFQMDFGQYVEKKTIQEFLTDIGYNYSEHLYSTSRPHYLQFIYFVFSDNLWLEIEPKTFEHSSIYSIKHKWDIEKLKKEKVGEIRLYYYKLCTKGCKSNSDSSQTSPS